MQQCHVFMNCCHVEKMTHIIIFLFQTFLRCNIRARAQKDNHDEIVTYVINNNRYCVT